MSRGAQIKKEDVELYRFFISDKNKKRAKLSKRISDILMMRYDEKMTYKDISKIMGTTELKVRTELRLFKRQALIAKWYTERVTEEEKYVKCTGQSESRSKV